MAAAVTEHSTSGDEEESTKTFKDRLEDMPTYNIAVDNLQSLYSTVKGSGYFASYFSTGEDVAARLTAAAKPVVMAATDMACKVASPVVGEIKGSSIDSCAAEVLAKVQEKLPCMKQDPREYVEAAKCSAKDTANYYIDKVQGMAVTQNAVQKLDNAVAMTDLVVELCLPTDGSCAEDMAELEKAEEEEDQGVIAHANNVRRKAYRRGTRKLMSYKHVQTTVDMVQYAQNQISETTGKLLQGSSYVASPTTTTATATATTTTISGEVVESPQQDSSSVVKVDGATNGVSNLASELAAKGWDAVYKTSMFIPGKALEVTGEVYVSAKEMVFSYSNVNKINEIPSAVSKTVESYYNNVSENEVVQDIKDKAVAFAYVPTQVVSSYLQANRVVQWIIPNYLKTESIQVIENTNDSSCEPKN